MKTCKRCLQELPIGSFYKHKEMSDGHLNFCKTCTKSRVTSHRKENIERIRAYDRDRGNRQTIEDQRDYRNRNPEKHKAHNAVNNAVRDGRLLKPDCCSVCSASGRIEGHHHDYSKPLDVEWLCAACHKSRHANET